MVIEIITIYCLCDDFVKAMRIQDDPQAQMTTAEVMTTALVAARFLGGNIEASREFLQEHHYIPAMLGKSRLNRRLHAIPLSVWHSCCRLLGEVHKHTNPTQEYIVDSLPVPVCDNMRIRRCRLYRGEAYRGYIASKRRYFYGLRVHLLVTATGQPVEFTFAPASEGDISIFKGLDLDLPAGATIYADKSYNDYGFEDFLQEGAQIALKPLRKKNSKRAIAPWAQFFRQRVRRRIETSFSQTTQFFAKTIHAVTSRGFELKVVLFILAFTIHTL